VFNAHRLLYHSTLGLRVIKKIKKWARNLTTDGRAAEGRQCQEGYHLSLPPFALAVFGAVFAWAHGTGFE